MGWVALSIYGLGDILGAGIYGLVGKAAKEMGNAAWMAFVASMIAAAFTGLSYASLGSRYPKAAGASYISFHAFDSPSVFDVQTRDYSFCQHCFLIIKFSNCFRLIFPS